MKCIRIELLGNVAFENNVTLSTDFKYDIPTDPMGIPCLPLSSLLPDDIVSVPGLQMSMAYPEGYLGLMETAYSMQEWQPDIVPVIRACFTEERYDPEEGQWVRYLKAGQVFKAFFSLEEEAQVSRKALEEALVRISRIGIQKGGITGRVSCSLCPPEKIRAVREERYDHVPYERLEYTIMPLTPLCMHAPYAEGSRTLTYVPGMCLREELRKRLPSDIAGQLKDMVFANAYIGDGTRRLLPLPLCMSLVKLDKSQLHYRLSSGKDPNRVEQDVGVGDAYADGFMHFLTKYSVPETERIRSRDQQMYDALSPGQMFQGVIYGKSEDLRAMADFLDENPFLYLGHLREEGFGQAYLRVDHLKEKEIGAETLARRFDVSCLSPALLINDAGMPDTNEALFLEEIERLLKAPGRLRAAGRYMEVYKDFSPDPIWGTDGPVTRCLAKGSVVRLETADGQPIDISPILHGFVGERTEDGYGEIMAYPASECYYRMAQRLTVRKYELPIAFNWRIVHGDTVLIEMVLKEILKRRIRSLAWIDRMDPGRQAQEHITIPLGLLRSVRAHYAPSVSDQQLEEWYLESLEEEESIVI